jgi:hypothetical protein
VTFADDFEFAMASERAVEITFLTGETLLTGVQAVDREAGAARVYASKFHGDLATTTILMELVASVTVTEIEYKVGPG